MLTSGMVVLIFVFMDKFPLAADDVLYPGFLIALLINGSLHDRVMRGFGFLGVTINCLFYSAIVLVPAAAIKRLRKSI